MKDPRETIRKLLKQRDALAAQLTTAREEFERDHAAEVGMLKAAASHAQDDVDRMFKMAVEARTALKDQDVLVESLRERARELLDALNHLRGEHEVLSRELAQSGRARLQMSVKDLQKRLRRKSEANDALAADVRQLKEAARKAGVLFERMQRELDWYRDGKTTKGADNGEAEA